MPEFAADLSISRNECSRHCRTTADTGAEDQARDWASAATSAENGFG